MVDSLDDYDDEGFKEDVRDIARQMAAFDAMKQGIGGRLVGEYVRLTWPSFIEDALDHYLFATDGEESEEGEGGPEDGEDDGLDQATLDMIRQAEQELPGVPATMRGQGRVAPFVPDIVRHARQGQGVARYASEQQQPSGQGVPGTQDELDRLVHDRQAMPADPDAIHKVHRLRLHDGRVLYHKTFQSPHSVEPYAELATSRALSLLGVPVPPVTLVHASSQASPAVVAPEVPGQELRDIKDRPDLLQRSRQANPPIEVGKRLVAAWLLQDDDRHSGNEIIGPDGTISSIDHGVSLAHDASDSNHVVAFGSNHPAFLSYRYASPQDPLDKDHLRQLLSRRQEVMAALAESLPESRSHDTPQTAARWRKWRAEALRNVGHNFDQIPGLLAMERPTLADLKNPHTPRGRYDRPSYWALWRGEPWPWEGGTAHDPHHHVAVLGPIPDRNPPTARENQGETRHL